MTYNDIKKANEQIETTNIKGKEYAEVNQRIKAFRMVYPNGSIATHIESLQDGVVIMSCEVRDEEGNLLGKAHAYEKEDSSFINKTSYIENCCTSCTGRALGYCGFGIDTSVASYEEVQNAINNQNKMGEEKIEENTKLKALCALAREKKVTAAQIKKKYEVKDLSEMTDDQIADCMTEMYKL